MRSRGYGSKSRATRASPLARCGVANFIGNRHYESGVPVLAVVLMKQQSLLFRPGTSRRHPSCRNTAGSGRRWLGRVDAARRLRAIGRLVLRAVSERGRRRERARRRAGSHQACRVIDNTGDPHNTTQDSAMSYPVVQSTPYMNNPACN
jgi:hypothetical protein